MGNKRPLSNGGRLLLPIVVLLSILITIPTHTANAESYAQVRADALSAKIAEISGTRNAAVAVIPIGDAAQTLGVVGYQIDTQLSVASAFKGPVAIYFFENVDPAIWKSYPVRYWNELNEL